MQQQPYIIGIAGGSASGKTTLLNKIRESFTNEEVCIISQDDYYRSAQHQKIDNQGIINYDLPSSIDDIQFIDDIRLLEAGETIIKKEYVFGNPTKEPIEKELKPAKVIVVEGLFILWFEEISKLLQLKIFVDARDDIKWQRRVTRDTSERNINVEMIHYQWHNHVYPAYKRYLLPFRDEVDIIITNNYTYHNAMDVLIHHIQAKLKDL